ncbi:response regulator transcription factor [Janibacter sp. HTCC2649]|uniref:response regulator transcription factor n=1 Tax=Janibacter sp. HTCC2649 TaxID=313589 RepID=UPI000322BB1D|nr:response regulator [Janibacter sp. HTCC2649]
MQQSTVVNVVVADDDADIRDLVELKLSQSGYAVRSCSNGVDALAEIRRDPPALAVLDVMMPGLSGIDVLREIRADDALGGVRVVLLTARSRDTDVDMGFSTGADDYLIKPFSPRELVHRIAGLIARPR